MEDWKLRYQLAIGTGPSIVKIRLPYACPVGENLLEERAVSSTRFARRFNMAAGIFQAIRGVGMPRAMMR